VKPLLRRALCDIERVTVHAVYLGQRFYKIGYIGLVASQLSTDGVRIYGNVQELFVLPSDSLGA
jgi:hypothetical protein